MTPIYVDAILAHDDARTTAAALGGNHPTARRRAARADALLAAAATSIHEARGTIRVRNAPTCRHH